MQRTNECTKMGQEVYSVVIPFYYLLNKYFPLINELNDPIFLYTLSEFYAIYVMRWCNRRIHLKYSRLELLFQFIHIDLHAVRVLGISMMRYNFEIAHDYFALNILFYCFLYYIQIIIIIYKYSNLSLYLYLRNI